MNAKVYQKRKVANTHLFPLPQTLPPPPPPPPPPASAPPQTKADASTIPDGVARLFELCNDLDAPFPTPIAPAHTTPHIGAYLKRTLDQSTEATCCVCSEMMPASTLTTVPQLPNAQLLAAADYGEDLPGVEPVNGLLLDRAGLVLNDGGDVTGYMACATCLSDLKRKLLPACAIANGHAVGAIPPELQGLTITERALIAAYRVKGNIYILSQVGGSGTGQRAMRGNVAVFPQDAAKVAKLILPLPVDSLADTIAIVFIKDKRPTPAQLKKLFMVRASKVRAALLKLAEIHTTHGSAYADFQIDEGAFAALPEGEVPKALLDGITEVDESSDLAAHAGYVDGIQEIVPDADPANPNAVSDPVVLSFSAYVDSSGSQHWSAQKQSAGFKQMLGDLRRPPGAGSPTDAKQPPLVAVPHAPTYARDYDNPTYWTDSYVDLFPYGRGGPEDQRRRPISIERYLRHHMCTRDPRFRKDPSFLFVATNHLLRKQALLGVHLKMKQRDLAAIEAKFGKLSAAMLERVVASLDDPKAPVDDATRELAAFLRKTVESIQGGVPFSDAAKKRWRQEIFSLMVARGFPLLWITVNPADLHHPMVVRLAKPDENLGDELINSLEQGRIVAGNPLRAAQFFSIVMDGVFEHLVKCFGDIKAYYGVVEAQGRGTLHCHFLLWVNGYHTPTQLAEQLIADPELRERMVAYAEAVSTAVLPPAPPADAADEAAPDPPVLPAQQRPHRVEAVDPTTLPRAQFDAVLRELAVSNQTHRHSASCYIYGKLKCRHNFPFDLQEQSAMDADGKIILKRADPWVAKYNEVLLWTVRCNCNIELVTGSKDARAITMYLTEYMVKNNVTAREIYVATGRALRRIEADEAAGTLGPSSRTRALITKSCIAMVGLTQVSAPEAILLLMGYKDHYASATFAYLPVQLFVRWAHRAGEAPTGDDDVDLNGLGEGNMVTTASIVEHYLLRPAELAQLCLYDFVATISVGPYDVAAPTKTTMQFLNGHPQQRLFACRIRRAPVVPTLSYLPPSATSDAERHGSWHALLFVPFRKLADLMDGPARTWQAVWMDALPTLSARLVQIVANIAEIHLGMTAKQLLDNERKLALDDPTVGGSGVKKSGLFAEFGLFDGDDDEDGLDPDGLGSAASGHIIEHTLDSLAPAAMPVDTFVSEAVASAELGRRFLVLPPESAPQGVDSAGDDDEITPAQRAHDSTALHMHGNVSKAMVNGWQTQINILVAMRKLDRNAARPDEAKPDAPKGSDAKKPHLPDSDDGGARGSSAKAAADVHGPSTSAFDLDGDPMMLVDKEAADALEVTDPLMLTDPTKRAGAASSTEPEVVDPAEAADALGKDAELTLRSVLDGLTPRLNKQQEKAFLIIGRHIVQTIAALAAGKGTGPPPPQQLIFYLGGPGGTGKSQVLKALRLLFRVLKREDAFTAVAYTGAAAVLIDGATIHSLAGLKKFGTGGSTVTDDLEKKLSPLLYIFVDEVSMLGSATLARLHDKLCAANHTAKDVPFGGVNVIFAGDFFQLRPVEDRSLFSHPEIGDSQTRKEVRALQEAGKALWAGLTHVVFLTELMRQSDPTLRELLMAVRVGKGTEEHRQRLLTHTPAGLQQLEQMLVDADTPPDDPAALSARRLSDALRNGPVVVARNNVRFELILRTAERLAAEKGTRLLYSLPKDAMPKASTAFTPAMRAHLLRLAENETGALTGILPLIAGEVYYFNMRIAPELSAVNGMPCRLIKVFPSPREPPVDVEDLTEPYALRFTPLAVLVEVLDPAVPFHLDGFERNHMVLTPVTASFVIPLHKLVPGLPDRKATITITRTQFHLTPSWSVTTYKIQGKTVSEIVGDLRVPKKNGKLGKFGLDFGYSYTTLSRVTNWDGLGILCDFELAALQLTPPADLVEHMAWLEQRARATDAKFAETAEADADIDASPLMLLRPGQAAGDFDLLKAANDLHEQHLASMRAELAHRAAGSKRKRDVAGVKQPPPAKQARIDQVDIARELVPTFASAILQIRTTIQMQAGEPLLLDGPDVARRLRAHALDPEHAWGVFDIQGAQCKFGWREVGEMLNSRSYVNDNVIDAVLAVASRIVFENEGARPTTAMFRCTEIEAWIAHPRTIRRSALHVAAAQGCVHDELTAYVGIYNLNRNHWVAVHMDLVALQVAVYDSVRRTDETERAGLYAPVVRVASAIVNGPVALVPVHADQPLQTDGTTCSAYASLMLLERLRPQHGPVLAGLSGRNDVARLWMLQTLLNAAEAGQ